MNPTGQTNLNTQPPTQGTTEQQAQNAVPPIQTANVNLPNNAQVTIQYLPPHLDEFSMHLKYLSNLVEAISQLAINGCITILTWMSAQSAFTQNFASTYGPKIFETINNISDLAKKQLDSRPPTART